MSGFSGSSSSSGNNKRPFEGDDVSSNKKSFFTVLGANTASSKLDESSFPSTSFDSLTQLLSWFQTNQFQGLEDLEFKASETCGGSLGCFAKKDFAVGDLLFTVPQSSILSTAHVLQSPITKFIYEEAIKRKMLSKISVELLVWLCMIDEQRDDQHFQVYVQSLAKYSPSLLNWDPNLLALFDQTNLGTTIKTLEGKLNEYAELLREMRRWNKPTSEQLLPVERFNFNSLVWACGHYLSRRYPGQYGAPTPQDASIDLSKFSREADMGNVGAMIPLLDILNHSHEQEWLKFEVKDGALHVLCNYPVKAGEELLSNYGDLSNEQLLFAYGYALPSNPNDCFFVKLKLPVGNVEPPSKKNKKPQAPMQTESRIFSIKSGGWEGIPKVRILFSLCLTHVHIHNKFLFSLS